MDKRVIFAVAGSGKTTEIINQLNDDNRFLVVTYTNTNFYNLRKKIIEKFGYLPDNITLRTYFSFIYGLCYRPFLSSEYKTKGINFNSNPNRYEPMIDKKTGGINPKYYLDDENRLYSNRISKLVVEKNIITEIKLRLEKYFDFLFIDEIQDIAGNDFRFLKKICSAKINMLFVGDYYQHTYDTSRDGSAYKNLFQNYEDYKKEFEQANFIVDESTLNASHRCSKEVCEFIRNNLGIEIHSANKKSSKVEIVDSQTRADEIFKDKSIVKLFYKEHYQYNCYSKNWGDSKGENDFTDVCVVMNKTTMDLFRKDSLGDLKSLSKNKFYVACSRPNRNLILSNHRYYDEYKKKK